MGKEIGEFSKRERKAKIAKIKGKRKNYKLEKFDPTWASILKKEKREKKREKEKRRKCLSGGSPMLHRYG